MVQKVPTKKINLCLDFDQEKNENETIQVCAGGLSKMTNTPTSEFVEIHSNSLISKIRHGFDN